MKVQKHTVDTGEPKGLFNLKNETTTWFHRNVVAWQQPIQWPQKSAIDSKNSRSRDGKLNNGTKIFSAMVMNEIYKSSKSSSARLRDYLKLTLSYTDKKSELAKARSTRSPETSDKYVSPNRNSVNIDKRFQKGPTTQTDGQKKEWKASRSHKEQSHDRCSEELNAAFRNWTLPKLSLLNVKLEFAGGPLKCPEWSQLFTATVHNANITKSNEMCYLENFVSGKAERILTGLIYDGNQNDHARKRLARRYCQLHIIVDSQLKVVQNFADARIQISHQKLKE